MEGLNSIIAYGATLVVGIGAVSTVIIKYSAKVKKAISVAKETLDLLDSTLKAVEPDAVTNKVEITVAEIETIRDEANQLVAALKALKS